jgi:acetyl esterase/lipase
MRRMVIILAAFVAIGLPATGRSDEAPAAATIDLWPGPAPGEEGSIGEEKAERKGGEGAIRSVTNVTKPTLTVYRPAKAKDAGAAIVVCPGGGYNALAWDHEGEQVARWLNSIGVTAAVLKYRVPRRPGTPRDQPPPQALMDAQRALGLVRSRADDWGIDPKRVGILGFSAGGHLAAWAATNADRRTYEPVDAADRASCRPDFAVLIYPGGVVRRGTDRLAPEIRVSAESPPMFLAHAGDDRVSAENSVYLYLALKRAEVPAELHVYASGGHGFGLRPSDKPCSTWPKRCEEWLRDRKLLAPETGR